MESLVLAERTVESELRDVLEAVKETAPATRAEIRAEIEQRGGSFSGRALAEAIRRGLIRPFFESGEAVGATELEARIEINEAYVLTLEGESALAAASPPKGS